MKRLLTIFVTILTLLVLACAGSPAPKGPKGPKGAEAQEVTESPAGPENAIPTIQGRAHRSPLVGRQIAGVRGVVTAVLSGGRAPGFWMQDPDGDRNDATSDAIFVSTAGLELDVAAGDAVSVTGKIAEAAGSEAYLTTTQIVEAKVDVVSRGNELPAPVLVGVKGRRVPTRIAPFGFEKYRPREAAIDFWESLEGMRVEIRDPVVVGATSQYGDMVVLADKGAGAKERSTRGGVVFRENAANPERVTIDPRLAGPLPTAHVGDWFEGSVTGIIDYAFGNYRLVTTSPLPPVTSGSLPPEVTRLRGDERHVTIATYNVLNLSAANDDERFRGVAASIVENLGAPDVVGLQEIQDDSGPEDDGVVTAARTFAKLIDAIEAEGGPRYDFRQIDPIDNRDGGQPGGNIRVGLLFNPARVQFVDRGAAGPEDATKVEAGELGSARLSLSPGRIDPSSDCFAGGGEGELAEPTRKSLAAELRFNDRTFFVIVNHFKSKRGDNSLFGAVQPPVLRTEEQRTCQAEVVGGFAAGILKQDSNAGVVVLGDMNEHEYRKPMKRLTEVSGLTNLIERIVVADRYTFVFQGNSQVLDHVFVSPSLLQGLDANDIDIVHVNVDRADADAASDHDPVLVRLRM
jgi:uncharacterized protein